MAVQLASAAPSRKQLLLQLIQSPHWDGAVRPCRATAAAAVCSPACPSSAPTAVHAAPAPAADWGRVLMGVSWWAQACVRYSPSGARFGGLGSGGLVAVWRQDQPPGAGGLVYADWVHHVRPGMVLIGGRADRPRGSATLAQRGARTPAG